MPVTVEITSGTARIILTGNLDYSTRSDIQQAIRQVLEAENIGAIEVDFEGAAFLDSSAISALLSLQKSANRDGQSLALTNCSDEIREIFMIGGFDRVFMFR